MRESNLLSIQEAAKRLKVSTKTLRRWEERGVLIPQRTDGNHRRYSEEQIANFWNDLHARKEKNVSSVNPIGPFNITEALAEDARIREEARSQRKIQISRPVQMIATSAATIGGTLGIIFLIIFLTQVFLAPATSGRIDQKIANSIATNAKAKGDVLAASTSNIFKLHINVPSEFSQNTNFLKDVTIKGLTTADGGIITDNADVNAGTGKLTASNVIYSITAGQGIGVTAGQNPTISNSGVLSLQGQAGTVTLKAGTGITISGTTISNSQSTPAVNSFANMVANGTTITASGNDATLNFAVGSGLSITGNSGNNTITINPNGSTVGTPSCVVTTNGIVTGSGTCQAGVEQWQASNGILYPVNSTYDLAIGGTSSSSAKFAVLNVSNGNPTASVSGSTGAAYITASGNLATTNMQTLTLGGGTTGNVSIQPNNGSGVISLDSLTVSGSTVTSGIWHGTLINTQYGGTGVDFSATVQGSVVYFNGIGSMTALNPGSAGQCLTTNGGNANPSWTTCASSTNYWQLNNGALSPFSNTADLLLGATSTNSAKFGFINVTSGTPTASISANSGNIATVLTGLGVLGTTNAQTLTLGSASTGNISLSPAGSVALTANVSGNVGIGTSLPSSKLDVQGAIRLGAAGANNTLNTAAAGGSPTGDLFWGSRTVCDTSGNCAGTGAGVGGSGTTNRIAKFSGTFNITNSSINDLNGTSGVSQTFDANGNVGFGTATSPITLFEVQGAPPGKALAVFDYTGTDQNILTASASGVSVFTVANTGSVNIASGATYKINNVNVLSSTTLGSAVVNSSLTQVGALSSGSIASGFGTIATTNTITGTSLNGTIGINTGAGAGTQRIDNSGNLVNINNITAGGTITFSGFSGANNGGVVYANSSGVLSQTSAGTNTQCLLGGTTPTFGSCGTGVTTDPFWSQSSGLLYANNSTVDFSIGGQATTSAKFAVLNVNSGTPVASLSAGTNGGSYLTADGTLQTTANQSLTLGGSTTGNITISPLNGAGVTTNTGNFNLSSGKVYQINGTSVLSSTTLGSAVVNSSLTQVGALSSGSIASGFGTIATANTITGTTLNGTTGINTGATAGTQRIDSSGNLVNIGTTQLHGITYTWPASDAAASGYALTSNGSGALSWTNTATFGTNYWQLNSGAISPFSNTLDVLVGATSTTSAKFAVLNVNSGTPVASLSAGTNGGSYLTADGTLQTTANQSLTLGGSTTGNITISPLNGAGVTTNTGNFNLSSGKVYQINGTSVLSSTTLGSAVVNSSLTQVGALSSGSIASGFGTIATANTITGTTLNGTTGINTGATAGTQRIDSSGNLVNIGTINAAGAVTFSTFSSNGGPLYTNGSGVLAQVVAGTNQQCLLGGTTPTFGSCQTGFADPYWQQTSGTLLPNNSTVDFLIGGQATTSAKFAVLNVNSGTPVASLSAGTNGGAFLTADGYLSTTAKQSLTLGNSSTYNTTGNILLSPNGTGNVGIGTTSPTSKLQVTGSNAIVNIDNTGSGFNGISLTAASGWKTCIGTLKASNYWYDFSNDCGTTHQALYDGVNSYWSFANGVSVGSGNDANAAFVIAAPSTTGSNRGIAFNDGSLKALIGIPGQANNYVAGSTTNDLAIRSINASGGIIFGVTTGNGVAKIDNVGNFGIGSTAPTAQLYVTRIMALGANGKALAIFDQNESQDILTASASGTTKFVLSNAGNISFAGGQSVLTTLASANTTARTITIPLTGSNDTFCLATAGNCAGTNYWQLNSGAISPFSNTLDVLVGATSTTSAKFAVLNVNSGTPVASLSAGTNGGSYLTADGTLQTTANQSLTLGGSTTGNITISPLNGAGVTTNTGNFNLSSGKVYQINGTSVLSSTTLGSAVVNSSLTQVGALSSGSIASGFGTIATANTITGTTLNGTTGINTGATAGTQRIDSSGNLVNIGTTQLHGITYTWPASDAAASGYALTSNGSGALSWTNTATFGTNYWQLNSGAISPFSNTLDVLVGATSTTSAKFAVLNVNSGTPVASLSAGTNGGSYLTADGTLQTTANQSLTLGGSTTGNITISPLNGAGVTTNTGNFNLSSGKVYQINGTSVLSSTTLGSAVVNSSLTQVGALSSGSIASGFGTIATANTITGTTLNGTTGINTGATAGTQRIDSSGNLVNIGTTQLHGITYTWPASDAAASGYALTSNGSGALSWTNTATFGTNYWQLNSGAISPFSNTLDVLVGATSTTSAKFAVLNVNSGTPVASLSAGTNGGSYLTADGTLQTTANQSLTLGGSTTGNITISPLNGAGVTTNTGNFNLSSGKVYQINGTSVLSSTTLGSAVVNSSLTQVGALSSGSIASGFGTIATANTITGTTLNGTTGINTGATAGTQRIDSSGNLVNIGTTQLHGITYTWPASDAAASGYALTSNGSGALSWTNTATFGTNYWQLNSGAISPFSNTLDVLVGATSTTSAKFAVLNVNSGTPVASLSAGTNGGSYLTADGTLQTTANQSLTLGGSTTGNITISPLNGAGVTTNTGNFNLSSGKVYQINGTSVLSSTTLGSAVVNSSLTQVGALSSGSIASGFGTIATANTITGTTLNGTTGINTGATAGTQRIDSSGNLVNIGTINAAGAVTFSTFSSNGGPLYTNGSGVLAQVVAGTNQQCLLGGTTPTFGSCQTGFADPYWQQTSGTLLPNNSTVDFLIGGQATTSAKFAVLNVNSGTPVASLSAGTNGGSYLTAAGNLATTAMQSLTIGGNTTGNIIISPLNGSVGSYISAPTNQQVDLGRSAFQFNNIYGKTIYQNSNQVCDTSGNCSGTGAGIGGSGTTNYIPKFTGSFNIGNSILYNGTNGLAINSTTPIGVFDVIGGNFGGNAAFIVNQNGASGNDIITASASGTTKFTLTNGGSINIAGGQTSDIDTLTGTTLKIGASTATTITLGRSGQGIILPGFTGQNGVLYGTQTTGVVAQATTASTGLCLTSGASAPSWTNCSAAASNYWQLNSGAISPFSNTLDVLVGATSTTSAKFAVLNVNSGTPVASLSAGTNGGSYLTADGTLQTTANQSLTLGGSTTGNITISPLNGAGVTTNTGNFNLSSGKVYQINGTSVLSSTTLGSAVVNSSLTQVGALSSGSIASGFGTIATANTITGTTLNGTTGINTGATAGTQRIDSSGNLVNIGTINAAGAVTFSNYNANNNVLFATVTTGLVAGASTNSTGLCLTSGASAPSWTNCSAAASNYWQLNSGAISPFSNTLDVLVGATSTTSAKFAVLNVNSGTPVASLSAGTNGGSYLTADGTLQTTANQSLTLGGSTTGNITISPLNGAGVTTNTGNFNLSSGKVYQINGTSVLSSTTLGSAVVNSSLTQVGALSSGSIASGFGTIATANTITGTTLNGTTGINTGATAGTQRIDSSGNLVNIGTINAAGAVTFSTFSSNGGPLYTNGSGVLAQVVAGTNQQCLLGGTTPTFGSCGTGVTTDPFWSQSSGLLYANNSTVDFSIGGQATTSAKFAVLNVNSGTPVASLSAGTNGGSYLTADGTLQTTANQSLTLGGSTTGNITISPLNGAGVTTNTGNFNLSSGKVYQINGTSVLSSTTLGSAVVNSSLTQVGALSSGSIASGFGTIATANTITGTTLNGTTGINTGATAGTQRIDSSGNLVNIGTINAAGAVTFSTFSSNGGPLYTNGSGVLAQVVAGTNQQCLLGGTTPTFGSCGTGVTTDPFWSQSSGLLYANNSTVDFSIGGQATTSAKFAVLNVNSGTPVASLSAGTNGGSYLTADGTLQTTANQSLTLGGSTTGNITISPLNGAGVTTNTGNFNLSSGKVYQINGTSVLSSTTLGSAVVNSSLTQVGALSSGSIASGFGTIATANTITGTTLNGTTGINTGATAGTQRIDSSGNLVNIGTINAAGAVTFSTFSSNGGPLYTNGSGVLAQVVAGTNQQCLLGGTTPTFGSCGTGVTTDPFWSQSSGLLYANNSTVDFSIGGQATTSAKFAVLNVNSGTPVASLSAGTNGGSYLTADGTLQTTANQSLTLGGSTTGNITISPLNGAGVTTNTGNFNLSSGKVYQINGTSVLSSTTLGSAVVNSSLTQVGALSSGSIASGFGTIATANTITGTTLNGTTGINTGATAGTQRIDSSGNLVNIGTTQLHGITYTWPASDAAASGYALTSNGSGALSWTNTATFGTNYWQLNSGAISPFSNTLDVLVGATSTTSAKFAVLNVNSGTPVASISANSGNNATYLTGAGTLATTNGQTLNIGDGSTTGNIIINAGSGVTQLANNTVKFTGSAPVISSTNTLTINAFTLGGDISAATHNISNIGTASFGAGNLSINANTITSGSTLTFSGATTISDSGLATLTTAATLGISATTLNLGAGSAAVIGTTSNSNLTLTPNGTGNTILTSTYQSGVLVGSSTNTPAPLSVSGGIGSNGAFIVNQTNSGDIIDASASGNTKFTIANSGLVSVLGGLTSDIDTLTGTSLKIGATNATTISIGRSGQGITLPGFTGQNGVLYGTNGSGVVAQATTASTGLCLTSGASNPTWAACPGGSANYWQLNSGAISPFSNTLDVLVGATSTTSAKFAVLNVNSTAPIASVSAQDTNKNAIYLDPTNGTLSTMNGQTLTLGGANTGNILLSATSGTVNSTGDLNLSSGKVFKINGTSVLSNNTLGSGVTASSLTSVGTITTGVWHATAIGTQWGGTGQDFSATAQGSIPYFNGTGTMAALAPGTANQCLTTAGASANPTWQTCALGSGTNWWTTSSDGKALTPVNSTMDLLIGSQATTSAKFSVLNMAGGTPTASISANSSDNATVLSGLGVLSTTNAQTLTLGDTNTGNILITSATASKYTIGAANTTGTLTLGQSTDTNTVQIGAGNTASGKTQTITIGSTATSTGKDLITIGNLIGASTATIQAGTGNAGGDINIQTAASGIINIGTSAVVGKILNLGTIGNTANASTVHIADTGGNATQSITIGNTGSANNAVLIQGGTNSTAISLQAGTSGTILLGTTNVNNVTIGSTANTGTLTLGQSTAGETINIGNGNVGSGNTNNISIGATATSTGKDVVTIGSSVAASSLLLQAGTGNLTLAAGGTGTILLTSNYQSGVQIGTAVASTPLAPLYINGGIGSNAALILNQTNSGGDIFTASASGTTKFTINNNGNIQLTGNTSFLTTINSAATQARTITLPDATGTVCLQSSGSCGFSVGTNWITTSADGKSLTPINSTMDFLIGSQATISAKFAVLNMNSGTPVASISANSGNNATYLTGDGTLAATNKGSLIIGNSSTYNTTGNVLINPNGTGNLGIGTSTPVEKVDVEGGNVLIGKQTNSGGTTADWSLTSPTFTATTTNTVFTGNTKYSAMVLDGSGFPMIGFTQETNSLPEYVHCGDANCSSGNSTTVLDNAANGSFGWNSDAIDATGAAVLTYYDSTHGDLRLVHCGNANCTSANTSTNVVSTGNVGKGNSIVLDASGFPVISYVDDTNAQLHVIHCGNAVCTSGNVDSNLGSFTNKHHSQIVLDASGFPVVVGSADTSGDSQSTITLFHCANANCSSGTVSNNLADTGLDASLQLDASGKPVISYKNGITTLKMVHCTDANCAGMNTNTVDSATISGYTSLKLDASGFPVIAYRGSDSKLDVAHCTDANCAGIISLAAGVDTNASSGVTPSLQLDSAGKPVIANSLNSSNLMLDHCSNVNCQVASPGVMSLIGASAIDKITASAVYNGQLYVGTSKSNGAEVYRYDGGTTWTRVSQPTAGTIASGGTANIDGITAMIVYNGHLYIGTNEPNSAEIYRYEGGTVWTVINTTAGTFNSTTGINGVSSMAVFQGVLYIGTSLTSNAETYRYNGGVGAAVFFSLQNTPGSPDSNNTSNDSISAMAVNGNNLYIGTSKSTGASVFVYSGSESSSYNLNWIQVNGTQGVFNSITPGTSSIDKVTAMTSYNGKLYIGTTKSNNAEVYRLDSNQTGANASFIDIGTTAGRFMTTTSIDGVDAMTVYNGVLYIGTNEPNKAEVYSYNSGDGIGTSVFKAVSQSTAGTIASGGTASINEVPIIQPLNGTMYIGTAKSGAAEVYSYNAISAQSYALKFDASATTSAEFSNSLLNTGSISFLANQQATNITGNSSTGTFLFSNSISTTTGAYDVAEDYPTRDDSLIPGDLVMADSSEAGFVKKADGTGAVLGVYSSNPGFRLSQQDTTINGGRAIPVALAGRVPVKVASESGQIKIGDPLTMSSINGVAMKQTRAGSIIGTAIENYDGSGSDTIQAFINLSYYDPDMNLSLSSSNDYVIGSQTPDGLFTINKQNSDGSSSVVDKVAAFSKVISANVIAGLVNTKKLETDSISATNSAILNLTSDTATVSGTLFANKIVAQQIQIGSTNIDLAALNTQVAGHESRLTFVENLLSELHIQDVATNSSGLTTLDNLMVSGSTSLNEANIVNNLTIGNNLSLTDSSINTTGSPLEIQPLSQADINFLGGKIKFDTDGKVHFAEDADFAKNVTVGGVLSAKDIAVGRATDIQIISDTEVTASGSSGLLTLKSGQTELKVNNSKATSNSLIFVTAKGEVDSPLYIKDQTDGIFTVGIKQSQVADTKFNFLISN